jgi:outer membrane protein assembly factor BamB
MRPSLLRSSIRPCILLVLASTFSSATAQEWTRFRGPNGTGESEATTIPSQWGEKDINWKIDLPGIGHSSPVLWGERIFLTSADPGTGTRIVLAVRTTDGKVLWTKEYPAATNRLHVQNSFASSTPTCDADHVYVAWSPPDEYHLAALDHDGHEVWSVELGKHTSRHGFGASPIVYEDLVIITNDHDGENPSVIAVDRATGNTRWKIPRKAMSPQNACYSTPFVYTAPGGEPELLINSWAHGVSSHNPKTGEVNWEAPVFELRTVGSPVLIAGLIFGSCGEGAGNNSVVAVKPGDKDGRRAEVAYQMNRSSTLPYVPTIVAAGDLAFLWGDRGIVTCIDAPSGKVHWRERVGGNYSASPIRIGDRILGLSYEGEAVVLAASPKFAVLARNQLGDATRATPAVADGKLYIRTQSKLMSIGGGKN